MSPQTPSLSPRRPRSLLQQLGGRRALAPIAERVVDRLRDDQWLAPVARDGSRMSRLYAAFMAAALGSGRGHDPEELRAVHAELGLEEEDIEGLLTHMEAAFGEQPADRGAEIAGALRGARGKLEPSARVPPRPASPRSALPSSPLGFEAMLDRVPSNVMYADTDFVIRYVNPASFRTLEALEAHLPIRARDVLGSPIDVLHAHPEQKRSVLRDPANLPHQARIQIGPETMDMTVEGIFDAAGRFVGTMLTWDIVTERVETEAELTQLRDRVERQGAMKAEMARVMSMMEQMPVNVIYCDRDFVIRYANPASIRTLEGLQAHLNVSVDTILGSSIDVFHKNPSHPRRMVGDPSNLPHTAKIQLGPEWLELLVSAIEGEEGEHIGTMVTWKVITEQIEREKERVEAAEQEREAARVLRAQVDSILAVVSAAARGDLTGAVSVSGDDAVGQLGEGLGSFLADLRDTMRGIGGHSTSVGHSSGELLEVAQTMAATAEQTSQQATLVSAAAEQVSQNVQTVAAGMDEMHVSVKEIAENAAAAASVATEGVAVAESTNASVAKLGESSREIGKVIKVITSIAQQTNLLALNATIEAARAGAAGKGFAVVANEVKELAKETAKATEDIGQKIEAIQVDTGAAVAAIDRISEIVNQVNAIQSTIATAVEEQTATTTEIARSVAEAARGSNEIAANICSVAEAAQHTAEGAASTHSAAEQLGAMAQDLSDTVDKFEV